MPEEERDQSALFFQLPEGKMLVGDSGYAGEPDKIMITNQEMPKDMIKWLGRVKARGETPHSRLKRFGILSKRFRHGKNTRDKMNLHQMAVQALCVVNAYDKENGHPLFDI